MTEKKTKHGGLIIREWTLAELLRERTVDVGECKEWLHGVQSAGHPQITYRGKPTLARRLAWCLDKGFELADIKGLNVWPTCGNRLCINPAHARVTTRGVMLTEMASAGRFKFSNAKSVASTKSRRAASRISMDDARAIRAKAMAGVRRKELAAEYGLCDSSIDNIVNGRTWREAVGSSSVFNWRPAA